MALPGSDRPEQVAMPFPVLPQKGLHLGGGDLVEAAIPVVRPSDLEVLAGGKTGAVERGAPGIDYLWIWHQTGKPAHGLPPSPGITPADLSRPLSPHPPEKRFPPS